VKVLETASENVANEHWTDACCGRARIDPSRWWSEGREALR
jgi:hypothetical protein